VRAAGHVDTASVPRESARTEADEEGTSAPGT
jgi:hypothetical protein